MRYKLPYYIFVILLLFWLFYASIPLIRIMHPSLAQIDLNLDPSSLGLATLLILTSFALILIEKIPPSAILEKLRISGSGVEAIFKELRQAASEVGEEEIPAEIKYEVEEILESDRHPKAAFLELIIEIEKKLKVLAEKYAKISWKYTSVKKLVTILQQHQIIDYKLGYLINSFWDLRNKVIHGKIEITTDRLNEAIQIGETILSKLEEAYGKQ